MSSFSQAWTEVVEAQDRVNAAIEKMNRALGIHETSEDK